MTKEDLSITYENNVFYCTKNNTKWISVDGEKWYGDEKRIEELEAQIEKMKCCENCQHWEGREPIPSLAEEGYYCFNDYPFECKRWELAEELKEIKEK